MSEKRAGGDMKHGLTGSRPALSILPRTGLIYGCRPLEYGADKYARGNYHGPPPAGVTGAMRLLGYIDAAQRHLTAVTDAVNRALGTGGDMAEAAADRDLEASGNFPASGLPHLAHALASLLIGVSCAVEDGLLPADPGQPWKTQLAPETGLPQKDDPAAERARVASLQLKPSTLKEREEAVFARHAPLRDHAFETLAKYPPQPEPRPSNAKCDDIAYQPGDCSTHVSVSDRPWQVFACESCRAFYGLDELDERDDR